MKTLLYNDKLHEYRLADDSGVETIIPSVTEIASAVTGKDLSRIDPAVLAEARERGKAIHKDVEDRAFKTPEGKWIKSQLPGVYMSERRSFGEIDGLVYGGTCDILFDGEIDDIKTIFDEDRLYWTIQANLYRAMFDGVERLNVLWTPKSGNNKKVPIEVLNDGQMADIIRAYRDRRVLPKTWLSIEAPEVPTLELVVFSQSPGELATNARVILETVKKQLAGYKAENYTETNIADAKRDKAELNSAAKTLNDKRLELERKFMEPFQEFKGIVTETVNLIKTASGQIDAVVKDVEEREKEAKRKLIEDYFAGTKCELFQLEQIFNLAWLNKGTKIKDVEAEITAKIEKVKKDLVVLDRIGEPEAKAHYLDTLNLDSALAEADRIKANRDRLTKIEAARAEAPAVTAPEEAVAVSFSAARQAAPVIENPAINAPEELLERTFRVRCSMDMLIALSQFMNANGIQFEKLEEAVV